MIVIAFAVLAGMLFLSAGTTAYWEAWLYLATLFLPVIFVAVHFLNHAPDLLERRMRMREKESPQKLIIVISYVAFTAAFVLPGLDHRHGWSGMPAAASIAADLFVLLGYAFTIRVLYENRYASRIIEVTDTQKVIDSGPYAVVRHPMYLGVLVMYLCSPLALGSLWALLPMMMMPPLLVARIRNEEALLLKELEGYADYTRRVRYRLLPGIW
jgi:protein-S-isoprenylcysteine O-methyltransferase Ste14